MESDDDADPLDPAVEQLKCEYGLRNAAADLEDITSCQQHVTVAEALAHTSCTCLNCAHAVVNEESQVSCGYHVQPHPCPRGRQVDEMEVRLPLSSSMGSCSHPARSILAWANEEEEQKRRLLRRLDVLTTENMVMKLRELKTRYEHIAAVRQKDAEICQLLASARHKEQMLLHFQNGQKTFTVNMMDAYQDQIDKLQREVCELRGQLSQATITEAEPVQDESQSSRQIPDSTTVGVGRQGEKQAAATAAADLDVGGSYAEDFSKKRQVRDEKSQVTTVRVGLQPQEWGDGENRAEFDEERTTEVTDTQESQLVDNIETLHLEMNATQREKALTDCITKLKRQLSKSQYEQSLAEASEKRLRNENRKLHQSLKKLEDQNKRSATLCRQEFQHEVETPARTHRLTTDSALPPTPNTQNLEMDMHM